MRGLVLRAAAAAAAAVGLATAVGCQGSRAPPGWGRRCARASPLRRALHAQAIAMASGGSIGGIVCGRASVSSLVGAEGVLGRRPCGSIRRPSIGGIFCGQASVHGLLVGAGGVLGLCPCGSYYALAATATVAAAGGRIGCSCVQPQMQLAAVVASAAAVCSRAGCKSAAAAAAAAAAAQCWRRWWKWAHSLGFETQQSNVAAAESSRGGRVSGSAAAEALAAAAQHSSVGGNGSRRCSAGIGGSGSAA